MKNKSTYHLLSRNELVEHTFFSITRSDLSYSFSKLAHLVKPDKNEACLMSKNIDNGKENASCSLRFVLLLPQFDLTRRFC